LQKRETEFDTDREGKQRCIVRERGRNIDAWTERAEEIEMHSERERERVRNREA
jgi:hypothetical protein